jgi:hypothetical protein
LGRGGSPTRPPCAPNSRADGARLNNAGVVGVLTWPGESAASRAERLRYNVGVTVPELEAVSLRTRDVFPMNRGRAVDGLRSTVMMVAEVKLSPSNSDSKALRSVPIRAALWSGSGEVRSGMCVVER